MVKETWELLNNASLICMNVANREDERLEPQDNDELRKIMGTLWKLSCKTGNPMAD